MLTPVLSVPSNRPNATFDGAARRLYPIRLGEVAGPSRTLRAGVSAMGFGGINTALCWQRYH